MGRPSTTPEGKFRAHVDRVLVAARKQGKFAELGLVTLRLRDAMARGITHNDAVTAHVLEGLDEISQNS